MFKKLHVNSKCKSAHNKYLVAISVLFLNLYSSFTFELNWKFFSTVYKQKYILTVIAFMIVKTSFLFLSENKKLSHGNHIKEN